MYTTEARPHLTCGYSLDFQILQLPGFTPISFTAASAACWHSHFTLLRRIADGDDDVALIFEDDIDMEWDLEKRLRYLWKSLPDHAWDQVMIGSSGGFVANEPILTCFCCRSLPIQRSCKSPATGKFIPPPFYVGFHHIIICRRLSHNLPCRNALCAHAYAVTKRSAARIVRLFRNPVYAYSRPIGKPLLAASQSTILSATHNVPTRCHPTVLRPRIRIPEPMGPDSSIQHISIHRDASKSDC